MSDDVARAVGSKSPLSVKIKGRDCQPRPLTLKELGELERDCLETYKRRFLESYAKNLDLLPEKSREHLIMSKMDEVSRWDIRNLPSRVAHDPKKILITDKLRTWLEKNMDGYFSELITDRGEDKLLRSVAALALDSEYLSDADYKSLTGADPKKTKVGYSNWWTTGTMEGRLTMVWLAFRDAGVSREEVSEALGSKPIILLEIAREIERLTTPAVGNG